MKIKNILGDSSPEVFDKLRVVALINVQVEEVVRNERSEARAFIRANR